MVGLTVDGQRVDVVVDRQVNVGFSGRDEEAVRSHVEELLARDALPEEPDSVPTTYEVAPATLLVDPGEIRVVGADTSGEAEFGLLITGRDTFVVAASDQTDRVLEGRSVQKAKQVAPNVISARAWRLDDVRDHWDRIRLRAWTTVDGERVRYQDATLSSILDPEALVDLIRDRYGEPMAGTVVLSGTVTTIGESVHGGDRFEVELHDPVRERKLAVGYDVTPM